MNEDTSNVLDEIDHHDGKRGTYACWSTKLRILTNVTTYGTTLPVLTPDR